jgi:calcineurin-like phosphoesterase family protein
MKKQEIWPDPTQILPNGTKSWGFIDIFDSMIMSAFQIYDDEYDWIFEQMDEEETDIVLAMFPMTGQATFSEMKRALTIMNKYKKEYHEKTQKSLDDE